MEASPLNSQDLQLIPRVWYHQIPSGIHDLMGEHMEEVDWELSVALTWVVWEGHTHNIKQVFFILWQTSGLLFWSLWEEIRVSLAAKWSAVVILLLMTLHLFVSPHWLLLSFPEISTLSGLFHQLIGSVSPHLGVLVLCYWKDVQGECFCFINTILH